MCPLLVKMRHSSFVRLANGSVPFLRQLDLLDGSSKVGSFTSVMLEADICMDVHQAAMSSEKDARKQREFALANVNDWMKRKTTSASRWLL